MFQEEVSCVPVVSFFCQKYIEALWYIDINQCFGPVVSKHSEISYWVILYQFLFSQSQVKYQRSLLGCRIFCVYNGRELCTSGKFIFSKKYGYYWVHQS